MKINWKVRIKNKCFWLAAIPMLAILIEQIFDVFGLMIELGWLSDKLVNLIETVFQFLALVGIVADPTTKGIGDSEQALTYETPKA